MHAVEVILNSNEDSCYELTNIYFVKPTTLHFVMVKDQRKRT